jgi:hypothetical protein
METPIGATLGLRTLRTERRRAAAPGAHGCPELVSMPATLTDAHRGIALGATTSRKAGPETCDDA